MVLNKEKNGLRRLLLHQEGKLQVNERPLQDFIIIKSELNSPSLAESAGMLNRKKPHSGYRLLKPLFCHTFP